MAGPRRLAIAAAVWPIAIRQSDPLQRRGKPRGHPRRPIADRALHDMEKRTGIAVPRTSVLRGSNGQSLVYEHTNAERFVPREVRTEPLDGDAAGCLG